MEPSLLPSSLPGRSCFRSLCAAGGLWTLGAQLLLFHAQKPQEDETRTWIQSKKELHDVTARYTVKSMDIYCSQG